MCSTARRVLSRADARSNQRWSHRTNFAGPASRAAKPANSKKATLSLCQKAHLTGSKTSTAHFFITSLRSGEDWPAMFLVEAKNFAREIREKEAKEVFYSFVLFRRFRGQSLTSYFRL